MKKEVNKKYSFSKYTKHAVLIRFIFALSLIICSRLFLGFETEARGRTDIVTSLSMIMSMFF